MCCMPTAAMSLSTFQLSAHESEAPELYQKATAYLDLENKTHINTCMFFHVKA